MDFDPHGLWLQGGERGYELRVDVPYDEMVAVKRNPDDRIGTCPAIRVQSRAAGTLLIASVGGAKLLSEIQERLHSSTA